MIIHAFYCNGCGALSRILPFEWVALDEVTHYCPREDCRRKMRAAVMSRQACEEAGRRCRK